MKRANAAKKTPAVVEFHPWSNRPGASKACWNGNNLEAGTTVPPPGSKNNPETGEAAEYAYGREVGKECARDYWRGFAEVEPRDGDLSETVCNLVQDPTRSEVVKRGALAGFLDELAMYTHCGIQATLYTKSKDNGRNYLALFGTRGFLFDIKDEREVIAGHLAVLTKAHHALSRLARIGAQSDKTDHIFDEEVEDAQDALQFVSAISAIFAEFAAGVQP